MARAELKGLLARKLRLSLTAFAIALGVTLMAGTYIFTDTINAAFNTIFERTEAGTDVEVHVFEDAGHAFLADYRDTYREAAAFRLWPMMLDFLQRRVG